MVARRFIASLMFAATATAGAVRAETAIRFSDAGPASGIDLTMTCGGRASREILEVNGGGVALFDFDRDGDLDVFLANGATMQDPEHGPGSRLYANRGDGTFTDVTTAVGLNLLRWAMGVAIGDVDGDGYEDVFVCCYGPNVLLRNVAGKRFVDASVTAGLADPRWATSAAFGDLDADGDLDLYVTNYLQFDVRNPPPREGKFFKGVPVMAGPSGLPAQHDVLYANDGKGIFRDVTAERGAVPAEAGYGLGVRIFDSDGDGRADILVGNDSTVNFLFRNQGARFVEAGIISGVASNYDGSNQATMGIALGDVDGNGYADVFTTNFSSDTNTLHLNLGDGFFDDRTSQFGLAQVSRPFLSWGTGFYDFDGDGDEDLLIASGHVYPEADTASMDSSYQQPLLLFERRGRRFERVTPPGAVFSRLYSGRAMAFGDVDADGDPDVVLTTLNGPVHVLRNESAPRSRLVITVDGGPGNPVGIGARVALDSPSGRQVRWIGGGSYQSTDAAQALFGLADATGSVALEVRWPDGSTSRHSDVPLNHTVRVTRGQSAIDATPLTGRR